MQFRCDCAGWLGGEERAGRCMSRGGGRERGEGEKEREEEERRGEGKGRWEEGREMGGRKGEEELHALTQGMFLCVLD